MRILAKELRIGIGLGDKKLIAHETVLALYRLNLAIYNFFKKQNKIGDTIATQHSVNYIGPAKSRLLRI